MIRAKFAVCAVAASAGAFLTAANSSAAILVRQYDVNNGATSYNAGTGVTTVTNTANATVRNLITATGTTAGDVIPSYFTGGTGSNPAPGNRAYLQWSSTNYGQLINSGTADNPTELNATSGNKDGGYTIEGLLYFGTTVTSPSNTAIGGRSDTSYQNEFLYISGSSNIIYAGQTVLYDGTDFRSTQSGGNSGGVSANIINSSISRNAWHVVTKVLDPESNPGVGDQVRWYVDGSLVATQSSWFDQVANTFTAANAQYANRSEVLGTIGGENGREIKGVGDSVINYYQGVLDDATIQSDANTLLSVSSPEPGSLAIIAIGGFGFLTRRRRAARTGP